MADGTFRIGATFDKSELQAGFDSSEASAKAYADSLNVTFQASKASSQKAFTGISQDVKEMADSVTADQVRMSEQVRATAVANGDVRRSLVLLKDSSVDAEVASKLHAAALEKQAAANAAVKASADAAAQAQRDQAAAAADAATRTSAQGMVQSAAGSGGGADDSLQVGLAAATRELNDAKAKKAELSAAAAAAGLDEATTDQALAAVSAELAEAEAAVADAKAALRERSEAAAQALRDEAAAAAEAAEAARALAEVQARANSSTTSEAIQRVGRAQLALNAAKEETAKVTSLVAASEADQATKEAVLGGALSRELIATVELTEAKEALSGASHHAVTDVQATSAAIRSLEGNGGIRAVEQFTAKTLGLGPAMNAIFPLVGAFAFGSILFGIGEKMEDVRSKAANAGQEFQNVFAAVHEKASVTNDDLRITSDRLQMAIDKLEGHPSNGIYLALDEARKMADQLAVSLRNDEKELAALLKEHEVSAFGEALSGVAATGRQQKEMLADQKDLTAAVAAANSDFRKATADTTDEEAIKKAGDRRDNAIRAAYQKQITSYKAEAGRLQQEQDDASAQVMGGVRGAQSVDNSGKIAAIVGRTEQLVDALNNENLQIKIAGQTAQKDQDEQNKELAEKQKQADEQKKRAANEARSFASRAAAAARAAAQEKLRGFEQELDGLKNAGTVSASAEYIFWQNKLTAFTQGSQQYGEVLHRQTAALLAIRRKYHEDELKLKAEEKRLDAEGSKALIEGNAAVEKWSAKTREDLFRSGERWNDYWKTVTRGKEAAAAVADEIAMAGIRAQEAGGAITHLGALQQEAALHAEQHRRTLQALQEELARLEAEQAKGAKNMDGGTMDPKLAAQIASVQNQIAQEQGKGKVQGVADKSQINQQIVQPYKEAFQQITAEFNQTVLSILKGQTSIGQGAKKLAEAEAGYAIEAALKWVEKKAQTYLMDEMLHLASTAKKAATDATANTVQATTTAATNTAAAASNAAVAGAAAFASTAAIPLVGPELAPGAAAAAYAGAMSFAPMAAFEQGTQYVPRAGVAMLHPGEAVLGSPAASVMRDAMQGKLNGGGGDVNLHMGHNNYRDAGDGFKKQWAANERHIVRSLKSLHRSGKLDLSGARG